MSELTIKLIIVLIPGAISTLIFGKLILHKTWSNFQFTLFSILFGTVSYLLLQFWYNSRGFLYTKSVSELTIWNNLNDASSIPYKEVGMASFISITLAFIVAKIENDKYINKFAQWLKISQKYGDENLYSMFLNSREIEYIYLRDMKNQLTYHGWVRSFSENDNIAEIRLSDVAVYNYSDSAFLYEVKELYLSLNKQEIIIEQAILKNDEQK